MLTFIRRHWMLLSGFSLLLVSVGSLIPLDQLPPLRTDDKVQHLIGYGLIMFPIALRKPKHWLWMAISIVLWSGAIELIQPYMNRYGEWADLAANTGGIIIATLLAALFAKMFTISEAAES